jgi:hypothetical protein
LAKYKNSTNTSKWTKTKWLLSDEKLQEYVPETKLFNLNSLTEMCEKYPTVYFKPTNGTVAPIFTVLQSGKMNS